MCQQLLIARFHERAPFGKRPREANIVLAGFRQTAEPVSGDGYTGKIAFHGSILLTARAPVRILPFEDVLFDMLIRRGGEPLNASLVEGG